MDTYSTLEMEAALCVWEDINERTLLDKTSTHAGMVAARENWGSCEMRHASMAIGRWCLSVYDAAGGSDTFDGWAYDWEVIPAMLDLIDWAGFSPMSPLPDVAASAEAMRGTVKAWAARAAA